MRVAIHTASTAVARTLETMIVAAGHTIAKQNNEVDLMLVDGLHPIPLESLAVPTITLATQTNSNDTLICPIRPQVLMQHLFMREHTQPLSLDNGWSLDVLARTVTHPEAAPITLTEKECSLLKMLVQHYPTPCSRESLLRHIWGVVGDIDTHTLETHIYRLRNKLTALTPIAGDILTEVNTYCWKTGIKC